MQTQDEFAVRQASWKVDGDALRGVRDRVFIEEQGIPPELEHDDQDPDAVHVIAEGPNGEPVGTGRLLASGQIGRMAVLPAWRNRGVGNALMGALLAEAASRSLRPFLNAQQSAVRFYAGLGFSPVGPEFIEAGIVHWRMEKGE